MRQHKQIRLLLLKASQDEYVLDTFLNDEHAPVEIVGFHAQQAVEKLLKATILIAGGTFPASHNIAALFDLARDLGAPLPDALDELRFLTPFAVEFRYDVMPEEPEEPLDIPRFRQLVRALRTWVESFSARTST